MAKITVVGQAMVVTSDLKFDDIQLVKKYRPDALFLYEGEGKEKEPIFGIGIGRGIGGINKYGAEFTGASTDGYAQITEMLPDRLEDAKAYVTEKVGVAILNLNKIEQALPAVIAEIQHEKEAIASNITVM